MRTERQVSAGGVMTRDVSGSPQFLLASRRNRSGALVWGLPKGLVEPSESPEQTARREVREETGWEGRIREPLGEIDYWFVWEGVRIHKVVHFYLMDAVRERPEARDHEMEEVRWFGLEEARSALGYKSERDVFDRAVAKL